MQSPDTRFPQSRMRWGVAGEGTCSGATVAPSPPAETDLQRTSVKVEVMCHIAEMALSLVCFDKISTRNCFVVCMGGRCGSFCRRARSGFWTRLVKFHQLPAVSHVCQPPQLANAMQVQALCSFSSIVSSCLYSVWGRINNIRQMHCDALHTTHVCTCIHRYQASHVPLRYIMDNIETKPLADLSAE